MDYGEFLLCGNGSESPISNSYLNKIVLFGDFCSEINPIQQITFKVPDYVVQMQSSTALVE